MRIRTAWIGLLINSLEHRQIAAIARAKEMTLATNNVAELGRVSDDSTAEMLSGMDQLISLALSDDCVISDKGAAALSKMTNLETLVVGGFITEAGVRQLASLASRESCPG